jgi:hypothetical protein
MSLATVTGVDPHWGTPIASQRVNSRCRFHAQSVIPHHPVRVLDAALFVFEMALSFAAGVLMGVLAQFRPAPAPEASELPQREAWELESRTGWVAIVLWIVVILLRAGIGIWGTFNEATLVESGGGLLLALGLNRGARAIVLNWRAYRAYSRSKRITFSG